jgi:two-component system, NtrC family, sensor kinase
MGNGEKLRIIYYVLPATLLILLAGKLLLSSINDYDAPVVKDFEVFEYDARVQKWNKITINPEIYNDLGFRKDTVKILFSLQHEANGSKQQLLELAMPVFRSMQLEYFDSSSDVSWVNLPNYGYQNSFLYPNPVFELPHSFSDQTLFRLKIISKEPVRFSISVIDEGFFIGKYSKILLFVSAYVGIMIALLTYNFILYFIIRDNVYLFYSFYIMFISAAQLSLLGFSYFFLFNENYVIYEYSAIIFSSLAGIFGVLFIKDFLKTQAFIPFLDKVLTVIAALYGLGIFARVTDLMVISYRITDLAGLFVVITFLTCGVLVSYRGFRPAQYFLVAWFSFLIGLFLYILHNLGFVNLGSFPNIPMLVGTALEAVLLSLALAYRINVLKKEKEKEQLEKVQILKDSESMIIKQNEMLEDKVKKRTEELEETLHYLQNTQTQLVNQEKMASLGQLTAGIAHEINNPINFVSSNISPLKRDIQDILGVIQAYRAKGSVEFSAQTQKQLKDLEEDLEFDYLLKEIDQLLKGMEDGAKRTVEIVRGLRLFSRVDEQDVKKVDLHDGINSTLVLLNSAMGGNIEIVKNYGEIPLVECLAGKINQVFMNIITNAVHALLEQPQKHVSPTLTITTDRVGDDVRIQIEDNGPGMPESVKQRIFEPFFTTKAVGKGTGLGLSIVYTIIENHKGSLEVRSLEGKGTNFIITLPILQNYTGNEG